MIRKFLLSLAFLFLIQFSFTPNSFGSTSETSSVEFRKGKKKKSGRYKKRKRLFKRKKDCDCPKY
jgi:hypothetical protein